MRPRSNYISPEQLDLMIQNIPKLKSKKWTNEQIELLFRTCYYLALRVSEGCRLKAEDFDFDRMEVYLGKTKSGNEEYVPIPTPFKNELMIFLEGKKGPLFPSCNRHIVYHWLVRLGDILNIEALKASRNKTKEMTKTHIFRKSLAKDMLYGTIDGRKAPINIISKQLRHKGKTAIDMTSKYIQADNETVKDWWDNKNENL